MSGFDNLAAGMEHLQEVSAKYADHQQKNAADIVYRKAVSDAEAARALKMKRKLAAITGAATALFGLLTIVTIAGKKGVGGIVIMAALTLLLGFITYKSLSGEPQVMTGVAVFKQEHKGSGGGAGKRTARIYSVAVKPDSGERVIYKGIRVSYAEYNKISEGTPVLVVKTGTTAEACVL